MERATHDDDRCAWTKEPRTLSALATGAPNSWVRLGRSPGCRPMGAFAVVPGGRVVHLRHHRSLGGVRTGWNCFAYGGDIRLCRNSCLPVGHTKGYEIAD